MVYFSLRESKQNKKGLSPIEVSITTNGKRIYFSTGKHVPAADWNKEKQAVKGKSEEAQLINGYLIAQGEVVVVADKYGVRITDIITPSERMRRLSR